MSKNFLDSDEIEDEPQKRSSGHMISLLSDYENTGSSPDEPSAISNSQPESMAETVRRSGLAYSAGIAFFASVVFMLVIGWGADLLLGSAPWGIVFGIVLGSVIGFVQFFRITSRIFKPETDNSAPKSLFDRNDPEK
jgi:F0F1-type ATP synthase assembly protein I